jgi:hypothetical protein
MNKTKSFINVKKKIHCTLDSREINVYLNEKNICKNNICVDENIGSLLKEVKNKIPKDNIIKFEDTYIYFSFIKII